MATSYRIQTSLQNKSFSVGQDFALGTGATVIPADRGPMVPIKINKGETERMKMLFGANRYEVLEAIAYNSKYPLWVSAPYSGGSFAALLLTDTGLVPCPLSFSGNPKDINFNNLSLQFKMGVGNGKVTAFSVIFDGRLIPDTSEVTALNASLIVGDTPHDVVLNWNASTNNFSINIPSVGSGDIIKTPTGNEYIITFSFSIVPPKGTPIAFRINVDSEKLTSLSSIYGIVGLKFPCDDFLAASVYKSNVEGNLILDIRHKKKGIYYQMGGYPVEISLTEKTVNGNGILIYAPELLKDDDFIFVLPNPDRKLDWDTWAGSNDLVNFVGGQRGINCDGMLLKTGWEQFKEFKKYPADIYFDSTGCTEIPEEFASLREEIPYRRFLYPQPLGTKASEILSGNAPLSNRGICTFWGSALIRNSYEPTGNLPSTLMGEIATKYADARVLSYGGRAVAWGDENGVGGQLTQGRIVSFLYDAKEDEMQRLDKMRINPVVMNELFGPMIASRRTTDNSETDYSYEDYSMVIDYCVERIVNEVLPYQLIKFNDDSHRTIVRAKAELILNPLLVAPNNVIQDYAVKCDAENNGVDVLTREEFVLTVAIKPTRKSEFIHFNFINSAVGGSVEEDVK